MKLTTFTDYSLRVLIHVASAPEARATIGEVARAYGISENHLVKVVHMLGREGFLFNTRGRGGGLRLARPAAQITVGQVVRAAEGDDVPAECFSASAKPCAIAGCCRLAGILAEAMDAFHAVLERYTLAELVADRDKLAAVLHFHPRAA